MLPPPAAPLPTSRSKAKIFTVVTLLAIHFALAVGAKRQESTTNDELVHLTAGVSYWQNNDYRLHPENGNLPQRWAALPAWLQKAKFPDLAGNDYWRTSDAWVVGHQFFYETGEDHFPRLMAGRAMIALFSVATGLLIFTWSRTLFGDTGALISLVFFAFCPTFLAHGALVTSDACMAFFFLAAVGAWWRHLHTGNGRTWWLSALTLGLTCVAKHTVVLLPPMLLVMTLVYAGSSSPFIFCGRKYSSFRTKLVASALSGIGQAAVAFTVIWAFYGFRFSAFNPALPPADHFIRPWAITLKEIGGIGKLVDALAHLHALPEAFLYGFSFVAEMTKQRAAFLNGNYSTTGWPTFFLWTFFLKSTVAVLCGIMLTAFLAIARWHRAGLSQLRRDLFLLTPLLVLFIVYWGFSLTSHLNIGHRHLLPIYPVLFIGMGALGTLFTEKSKRAAAGVLALLGWHIVAAISIAPHFIAYFNELSGGPQQGRYHLVDSSLDWGQDLPGLNAWLKTHRRPNEPVFLSYFGMGEPGYYRMHARLLASINNFKFPNVFFTLEPGLYCISATSLSLVYNPYQGPWTFAFEAEYQKLRALTPTFHRYQFDPAAKAELEREHSAAVWQEMIRQHDVLRFTRLSHYLQVRQPDAQIGYSLLIFRLSPEEVAQATEGSLATWGALIESAHP